MIYVFDSEGMENALISNGWVHDQDNMWLEDHNDQYGLHLQDAFQQLLNNHHIM